jgi:hypothetical protein
MFKIILQHLTIGIIKQNLPIWHTKGIHIFLLREMHRPPVNVVTAEPSTRRRSASIAVLREKYV